MEALRTGCTRGPAPRFKKEATRHPLDLPHCKLALMFDQSEHSLWLRMSAISQQERYAEKQDGLLHEDGQHSRAITSTWLSLPRQVGFASLLFLPDTVRKPEEGTCIEHKNKLSVGNT